MGGGSDGAGSCWLCGTRVSMCVSSQLRVQWPRAGSMQSTTGGWVHSHRGKRPLLQTRVPPAARCLLAFPQSWLLTVYQHSAAQRCRHEIGSVSRSVTSLAKWLSSLKLLFPRVSNGVLLSQWLWDCG